MSIPSLRPTGVSSSQILLTLARNGSISARLCFFVLLARLGRLIGQLSIWCAEPAHGRNSGAFYRSPRYRCPRRRINAEPTASPTTG
jgi:hypothetical protein